MKKEYICKTCGYVGEAEMITKGYFLLEIILYFFWIIPGLCYTIWRLSTQYKGHCPECHNDTMIPLDSPMGIKLSQSK